MYRIAHLSDLHFGSEIPAVVAGLSAALNEHPPDLVAISGDLTLRARRSEFRAARAFMDGLSAPVFAVPGNHDMSRYRLLERFIDPYVGWRRVIGPETEPIWQDGVVGVVGLNTARRAGWHLDWSRGRVGEGRLARCEARLRALPAGLIRIVVAHHPLLLPDSAPEARPVGGAKAALAVFARHRVRMVLSGHLHLGGVTHHEAIPAGEIAQGKLTVVLSATTTSHRLRGEPNAFNEIHLWPDGRMEVVPRAWDGERFAPVAAPAPALEVAGASGREAPPAG